MKGLFSKLNFPRVIILVSLIGCGVLGWLYYQRNEELTLIKQQLAKDVPNTVENIQSLCQQYTQLNERLKDDVWASQDDPEGYIRMMAQDNDVRIGQTDHNVQTKRPERGVEDVIYTITPQDDDRGFTRHQIANFMYLLEARSPRVKVTGVDMKLSGKRRPGPEEVHHDTWTFDIKITSRRRDSGG